jgi:hypothetical protein
MKRNDENEESQELDSTTEATNDLDKESSNVGVNDTEEKDEQDVSDLSREELEQ